MSRQLRQYSEGRRNEKQIQLQASKGTVISTPISRLSLRSTKLPTKPTLRGHSPGINRPQGGNNNHLRPVPGMIMPG